MNRDDFIDLPKAVPRTQGGVRFWTTEVGVRHQTQTDGHLALQRKTADDVARFLANGGQVTVVPPGATGLNR